MVTTVVDATGCHLGKPLVEGAVVRTTMLESDLFFLRFSFIKSVATEFRQKCSGNWKAREKETNPASYTPEDIAHQLKPRGSHMIFPEAYQTPGDQVKTTALYLWSTTQGLTYSHVCIGDV